MYFQRHLASFLLIATIAFTLTACDHLPDWLGSEPNRQHFPGATLLVSEIPPLTPDAHTRHLSITLPSPRANNIWPIAQHASTLNEHIAITQKKGRIQHTEFSAANALLWGDSQVTPIIADSRMYLLTPSNEVIALSLSALGKPLWTQPLNAYHDDDITSGGLTYANNTLYVTNALRTLSALDAKTGQLQWTRTFQNLLKGTPLAFGNKLYVMTCNSQLYALDTNSGGILWSHQGAKESVLSASFSVPTIVTDSRKKPYLIASHANGEIAVLNPDTGHIKWSNQLVPAEEYYQTMYDTGAMTVAVHDTLITTGTAGIMKGFDLHTGKELWKHHVPSITQTPWVAGDFLYFLTNTNQLVCMHYKAGQIKWTIQLPKHELSRTQKRPIHWTSPVLVNHQLLTVGSHGEMLYISAYHGKIERKRAVEKSILIRPLVADHRLFTISQHGLLSEIEF